MIIEITEGENETGYSGEQRYNDEDDEQHHDLLVGDLQQQKHVQSSV